MSQHQLKPGQLRFVKDGSLLLAFKHLESKPPFIRLLESKPPFIRLSSGECMIVFDKKNSVNRLEIEYIKILCSNGLFFSSFSSILELTEAQ